MIFDKRSLLLFASNTLLLHLMLLINSSITFVGFNLFILGPIFIIAPLYLRADQFFITSLLTGFWVDAALPAPFGLVTFLLLTIGSLILLIRLRFRAEKNFHPALLAHLANLITGLTLFYFSVSANFSDVALLLSTSFIELAISHLVLLFLAPWFFNFQRSLFSIFDTKTEPESLPFV
jgi:hypothetical protein